jgi:hypothetical protein
MVVPFDDASVKPILEKMPNAIVTPVEALSVEKVQSMHAA